VPPVLHAYSVVCVCSVCRACRLQVELKLGRVWVLKDAVMLRKYNEVLMAEQVEEPPHLLPFGPLMLRAPRDPEQWLDRSIPDWRHVGRYEDPPHPTPPHPTPPPPHPTPPQPVGGHGRRGGAQDRG
jgi:hypothetical protein